jgi:hypothetical protein
MGRGRVRPEHQNLGMRGSDKFMRGLFNACDVCGQTVDARFGCGCWITPDSLNSRSLEADDDNSEGRVFK